MTHTEQPIRILGILSHTTRGKELNQINEDIFPVSYVCKTLTDWQTLGHTGWIFAHENKS